METFYDFLHSFQAFRVLFYFIRSLALTIELPELNRTIWARFFLIRHFEQNFLLITGHFSSFCEPSLKGTGKRCRVNNVL